MPRARLDSLLGEAWACLRPVPDRAADPLVDDDADEVGGDDDEPEQELDDFSSGEEDGAEEERRDEEDGVERAEHEPVEAAYDALADGDDVEGVAGAEDEAGDDPGMPAAAAASAAADQISQGSGPQNGSGPPSKKQKTQWIAAAERRINIGMVFVDIETTSNTKKQVDRIIEIALVCYKGDGKEVGRWQTRCSNCGVPISPHAYAAHGISADDLRGKPPFESMVPTMLVWLDSMLATFDAAVLTGHNAASCDFPFIAVGLARAGAVLPAKLKYTLDTYQQVRRFTSLEYHKQDAARWPTRTKTGKPCLAVQPTVEYILKARGAFGKPDAFATFESACGQTVMGCSHCAVNLCSWACFKAWDHVHGCSRREVVVQYARPKEAVGPPTEQVEGGKRRGRSSGEASGGGGDFRKAPSGRPFGSGGK